jgi:hypothetical protein
MKDLVGTVMSTNTLGMASAVILPRRSQPGRVANASTTSQAHPLLRAQKNKTALSAKSLSRAQPRE